MHRPFKQVPLGKLVRRFLSFSFSVTGSSLCSYNKHKSKKETRNSRKHPHSTIRAFYYGTSVYTLHVYPFLDSENFHNGGSSWRGRLLNRKHYDSLL